MDTGENTSMDTCQQDLYLQYYAFDTRLSSYQRWPKQIIPDKFSLAKSGFFYTGQSDTVKCFCCGVQISNWESSDNSFQEHYKHSPKCDFLTMIGYDTQLSLSQSIQDDSSISSLAVNTSDCDLSSFSSHRPWGSTFRNQSWTTDRQLP